MKLKKDVAAQWYRVLLYSFVWHKCQLSDLQPGCCVISEISTLLSIMYAPPTLGRSFRWRKGELASEEDISAAILPYHRRGGAAHWADSSSLKSLFDFKAPNQSTFPVLSLIESSKYPFKLNVTYNSDRLERKKAFEDMEKIYKCALHQCLGVFCDRGSWVQSGWGGCRTGNGEKLSNSQVCYLAQLCLAAA